MLDKRVVLAVFSASLLAGCASSVQRPDEVSQADGESAKGELRKGGLVVTTRTSTVKKFDPVTGKLLEETVRSIPVVCVEPVGELRPTQPDLSAKMRSGTGAESNAVLKDVVATGEPPGSLAALSGEPKYRLCEEYVGDASDAPGYDLQLRRFQKKAVAALAIEHLTGASQGGGAGGAAEIYRTLLEQREARERVAGQIAELDRQKAVMLKTSDEADVAALEGTILRLKSDLDFLDKSIAKTKDGAASGKLKVAYKGDAAGGRVSDEAVARVADAVGKIVRGIVQPDDRTQACMSVLQRVTTSDDSLFAKWCTESFAAENQARLLRLKALDDLRQLSHRDPRMLLRVASDLESSGRGLTDGAGEEDIPYVPPYSASFSVPPALEAPVPKASSARPIKASEPAKGKGRSKSGKKDG